MAETAEQAEQSEYIGSLKRYAALVQRASDALDAGDIDGAERMLMEGPTAGTSDHMWRSHIWQEFRERREPALDLRAFVMERIAYAERNYFGGGSGYTPDDLMRFRLDRRLTKEALEPVVQALIDAGDLVLRRGKLWTPAAWKRASELTVRRTREKRASKGIFR